MIKILSLNKIRSDCYSVAVQDDLDVVGKDEKGLDIYRTFSTTYNPANGKESLKAKIEDVIKERKGLSSAESAILMDVKPAVESIDTTKLGVK